jgi:hypothetical protein
MSMEGDGPQGQPAEGSDPMDALAAALEPKAESEEAPNPDESANEEAEESEEVEAEEGEAEDEEGAEEPTFTIKVDGKDVSLKQSELIAGAAGLRLHQKDDGAGRRTEGD